MMTKGQRRYRIAIIVIWLIAAFFLGFGARGSQIKSQELEQFGSLTEFQTWLAQDTTDQLKYNSESYNCFDFAGELQKQAMLDGYIMSLQLATIEGEYHLANNVVIDDVFYIYEPQTDKMLGRFTDGEKKCTN